MSGLDDLIGGLLGGKGGAGGALGGVLGDLTGGAKGGLGGVGGNPMIGMLLPLVGGLLAGGGLQKLLAGFQERGLGAQADSWVGRGENEPVTAEQVAEVVGPDKVKQIAQQLGVSHEEAAAGIAAVLPHVVDHVSPEGQLPPDTEIDSTLDQLSQSVAAKTGSA